MLESVGCIKLVSCGGRKSFKERSSEAQPYAIPYSETPFFRTMYFMRNGLTGS